MATSFQQPSGVATDAHRVARAAGAVARERLPSPDGRRSRVVARGRAGEMIDIVGRLAVLAVPAFIGAAVARAGWWRDLGGVTDALNRFAVDVAFPMLIVSGITAVDGDLPGSAFFWLAVPLVDAVGVGLVWVLASRSAPSRRGTASLVGLFPNSAYLGLPLVVGVFGPDVRAAASAWVALQVGIAVAFGPPLLEWARRAGGGRGATPGGRWRHDVAAMLRRPLVVAPMLGLAVRAIGGPVLDAVAAVSDPIGRAASPTALFVLGIYCVTHAAAVRRVWAPAAAHVSWRMVGIPLIAFAPAWAAVAVDSWSPQMAAVFVALFAMPAGITTFALTLDAAGGGGHDDVAVVAATIVVSSVVALVTLAPTLAVLRSVLEAAA